MKKRWLLLSPSVKFAMMLIVIMLLMITGQVSSASSLTPLPVSISHVQDDMFVFVDYYNIYLVKAPSTLGGNIKRPSVIFSKDKFSFNNIFNDDVYQNDFYENNIHDIARGYLTYHINPTGVDYDKQNNKLYIANYHYHNVLIGRFSSGYEEVHIENYITDPDMKSPENVSVNSKKGLIAVADYDASGVFVFDLEGRLKWKKLGINNAHGVYVDNDYIYVTALSDKYRLTKFDLDGNLVSRLDNIGYSFGEYMYPTALTGIPKVFSKYYSGDLIVVDAVQGRLTVINSDLKPISSFGKNGGDNAEFNLPYGVAFGDRWLVIADTNKKRLVFIDPFSNAKEQKYTNMVDDQINIGLMEAYGRPDDKSASAAEAPAAFSEFVQRWFRDKRSMSFVPGTQKIAVYVGKDKYLDILLPFKSGNYGLDNRPSFGFRFPWMHSIKEGSFSYILIGCPSKNEVMVLETSTGFLDFVKIPSGFVVWGVAGMSSNAEFDLVASYCLTKFKKTSFNNFLDKLKTRGSALASYVGTLYGSSNLFLDRLDKYLYTNTGKNMASRWLSGEPMDFSIDSLIAQKEVLVFDELYILELMSKTPLKQLKNTLGYRIPVQ